jgi:DNA polymerase III delta subunit
VAVKRKGFIDHWSEGLAALAEGPLPPVVILAGDAPFVKERLVAAAERAHDGETEGFATRPGEADARALDRLLDDWGTATLFGSGRLIVARDVDKLLKGKGANRLDERLDAGDPPNRLLLTVSGLDGRTKLAKRIKKAGGLVSLPVLRDAPPPWHDGGKFLQTDLNQWLVEEARLQGLQLALPVADAMSRLVGNEPGRLAQTLQRLGMLLDDRTEVSLADVERHVPASSARLLARYEDAIREGRGAEALVLVDRMARDGVFDPFGRLVAGTLVTETVLRGLTNGLAREVSAHDALGPAVDALKQPPWKRDKAHSGALDAVLGQGGRRVFLEKELRRTPALAARRGFEVALAALRSLRDGGVVSLHAETVRLVRALRTGGRRR